MNSYAENRSALAVADLVRMEVLDFFMQFSSPAGESLANDNIMEFTEQYVLQYILKRRLIQTDVSQPPIQ